MTPHPIGELIVGSLTGGECEHLVHRFGSFEDERHAVELQEGAHRNPRHPFVSIDERMVRSQ
jgi:hypothetical protein